MIRKLLLLGILLLLIVPNLPYAQVFSHQVSGKHFEAEVMPDTVSVKTRNDLALRGDTNLRCPLGPAVRANVLHDSVGATKVCFVFSKEKCLFTSVQYKESKKEEFRRAGSFKCIELATVGDAEMLAALVNAGPQQYGQQAFVSASVAAPITTSPASSQRKPTIAVPPDGSQQASPPSISQSAAAASRPAPAHAGPLLQTPPRSHRAHEVPTAESTRNRSAAVSAPASSPSARQTIVLPDSSSLAASPAKAQLRSAKRQTDEAAAGVSQAAYDTHRAQATGYESGVAHKPSGRWILSRFMIKAWGNERLTENTYATASIVDQFGTGRVAGDHLYIRNESIKYALYYGLRQTADKKLEPGHEVTVRVDNQNPGDSTNVTRQLITLKWFDEAATTKKRRLE